MAHRSRGAATACREACKRSLSRRALPLGSLTWNASEINGIADTEHHNAPESGAFPFPPVKTERTGETGNYLRQHDAAIVDISSPGSRSLIIARMAVTRRKLSIARTTRWRSRGRVMRRWSFPPPLRASPLPECAAAPAGRGRRACRRRRPPPQRNRPTGEGTTTR
jgi:hypothetical protein